MLTFFCKFLSPCGRKKDFLDSFSKCYSFYNKSQYLVVIAPLIHYEDNFIPSDRRYVSMNTLWTLCPSILAVLRNTCIASPNTDHRVCTLIIQTAEPTAWRIGAIFKLFEGNRIPSINTAYQIEPPLYASTLLLLHDFSEWRDSETIALCMLCVRISIPCNHYGKNQTSNYRPGDPDFVSDGKIWA